MLSVLLALLASAFPVRGNTLLVLDSNLVIGSDTLHAETGGCLLGGCGTCGQYFKELQQPGNATLFPGETRQPQSFEIRVQPGSPDIGGGLAPPEGCPPGVKTSVPLPYKLIHRGTGSRALRVDTILYTIENTRLPLGGAYFMGIVQPVLVHWGWAPYDSTRPLVRWLDTIRLSPDDSTPRGTPVFSLRDSLRIDSIAPALLSSRPGALELRFDVRKGSIFAPQILWSTMTGTPVSAPLKKLAPGTDILFRSGVCDKRGSDVLWRAWSGGKAIDSFVVHTPTTVEIEERRQQRAIRAPSRTFDALGRDRNANFRQLDILFGP